MDSISGRSSRPPFDASLKFRLLGPARQSQAISGALVTLLPAVERRLVIEDLELPRSLVVFCSDLYGPTVKAEFICKARQRALLRLRSDLSWELAFPVIGHELGHLLLCAADGWPISPGSHTLGERTAGEFLAERLGLGLAGELGVSVQTSASLTIEDVLGSWQYLCGKARLIVEGAANWPEDRPRFARAVRIIIRDYAYALGQAQASPNPPANEIVTWLEQRPLFGAALAELRISAWDSAELPPLRQLTWWIQSAGAILDVRLTQLTPEALVGALA